MVAAGRVEVTVEEEMKFMLTGKLIWTKTPSRFTAISIFYTLFDAMLLGEAVHDFPIFSMRTKDETIRIFSRRETTLRPCLRTPSHLPMQIQLVLP